MLREYLLCHDAASADISLTARYVRRHLFIHDLISWVFVYKENVTKVPFQITEQEDANEGF